MPNANAPFGFRPIRGAYSQVYNDAVQVYAAAATDATIIRLGDPVTITGEATATGVPIVTRSTAGAGNAITGVAVGFRPLGNTEWLAFRPASTAYEVLVENNPFAEFEIQEDSNGGSIPVAAAGLNAAIVFGAASGSRSAAMVQSSSAATTAGLQVRLVRIARRVDNDVGNFAVWVVRLNNTTETPNAASTGV